MRGLHRTLACFSRAPPLVREFARVKRLGAFLLLHAPFDCERS